MSFRLMPCLMLMPAALLSLLMPCWRQASLLLRCRHDAFAIRRFAMLAALMLSLPPCRQRAAAVDFHYADAADAACF